MAEPARKGVIGTDALYLFNEGRDFRLYERLGAHPLPEGGVRFGVWAPNAREVSVIGDFNGWDKGAHFLAPQDSSGIWMADIEGAEVGQAYKYHIVSHIEGRRMDKADPVGFFHEISPHTASRIATLDYEWQDAAWMETRGRRQALDAPMSIYEVHLASWRRKDGNERLTYRELVDELVPYVQDMGFTHVEFMPVMEHPFGGSWGYQVTGYFAPTSRYGTPQDFMALIDRLHAADIGVILDWVPSHFPGDAHGLACFDGTHLYEHSDPRQGFHPDWNSLIFNYGRNEVRGFLISNAMFWLDKYHIDGLRVDAVASMLYLDYSRKEGEWIPNRNGGRENLDALQFIKELNETVYGYYPDVQMIAEESTAWPGVSRPVYDGGLGFGLKWDMGWMHDTLRYFQRDSVHRKYHQDDLTFRSIYAFHEKFVLSLSHDEFVHGKGSLLEKMAGDEWQKFANLRSLLSYMYAQSGKKLLFMGVELGQWAEWDHDVSLDWHLLDYDRHRQIQKLVADLNHIYRREAALHGDCRPEGFQWIDAADAERSIISFVRRHDDETILCVFNLTPAVHENYGLGVPEAGLWEEIFNSDNAQYGGSDHGNGAVKTEAVASHGREQRLNLTLPPLAGMMLKWKG